MYVEEAVESLLFMPLRLAHLHLELLLVATVGCVLQQLLNQVNVGHHHATAAITLAAQLIQSIAIV